MSVLKQLTTIAMLAALMMAAPVSAQGFIGFAAFAGDTIDSFEGIAGPLPFPNFGVTGIRGPMSPTFLSSTGLQLGGTGNRYINDWFYGQANISSVGINVSGPGDVIDGTGYLFVDNGRVAVTLPHVASRWGVHMGGNGVQNRTFQMFLGPALVDSFVTGPGITSFTSFTGWQSTATFDRIEWDGSHSGFDLFAYDDASAPTPTCMVVAPAGIASGDVALAVDTSSMSAPTVDLDFSFSTDGGSTFLAATAASASALTNPASGVAIGAVVFTWDSVTDGVGALSPAIGVLFRAQVDDGVATSAGVCDSAPFDVDNSALCGGICGDCNIGGTGPDILDALAAAQISAGLLVATMEQQGCCDVDSSGVIAITDALRIAQAAAGLVVTLTCL